MTLNPSPNTEVREADLQPATSLGMSLILHMRKLRLSGIEGSIYLSDGVMVICQLCWDKGCPGIYLVKHYSGCFCEGTLDEVNI